tara:strand:- start:442 stop:1170 length:729 start_codon:yes stop_codon:yes gene_type:complete
MYSTQTALTDTGFSAAATSPQVESRQDSAPRLSVIARSTAERVEIERYIAQKFASRYGATLREFMPYLLVLRTESGLGGALGMRRAGNDQPLFLEQYLSAPAEHILASLLGSAVERGSMVEIGNLVATWRGSSQMLFIALAALIVQLGAEWAVFTATPEVQKLLARLGVKQYVLGKAEGSKLGEQLADWGTYYQSSPSLVAVNAVHALNIFARQPMSSMLLASCKYQIQTSCNRNNIGSLYE